MEPAKRLSFYASALIGVNTLGVWELYLEHRQWRCFCREEMPPSLAEIIDEEDFRKSQAYGKERKAFTILCRVRDLIFSNVSLLTKLPSKVFHLVGRSLPVVEGSFGHCYATSVVTDAVTTLMSLPFDYYEQFVIEEKHGFNKMTFGEFVKDAVKSFLLRLFLLHPLTIGLILQVVKLFGSRFPLYFFLGATSLSIIFTFLYPSFIQPLFNTYTPIPEDSALYKKIIHLAKEHNFPLEKIYQVDGSLRSSHSNAYVYGFWKNKRIVIYDTLLKQMEEDDDLLLSVLCHEIGHWQYCHTYVLLTIGVVQLFCISFGAREVIFNPAMYEEFGFTTMNPFIGFTIFLSVIAEPLFTLLGYGFSLLSRQLEFHADRFAVKCGYGAPLRRALIIMQKANKSNAAPDYIYAALTHSHPPITQRIAAIDAEIKKKE